MANYSLAGTGAIATVLIFVLRFFEIDVDEGVVTEAVLGLAQAIAFVVWLYGQFRRKDLQYGLFRK